VTGLRREANANRGTCWTWARYTPLIPPAKMARILLPFAGPRCPEFVSQEYTRL